MAALRTDGRDGDGVVRGCRSAKKQMTASGRGRHSKGAEGGRGEGKKGAPQNGMKSILYCNGSRKIVGPFRLMHESGGWMRNFQIIILMGLLKTTFSSLPSFNRPNEEGEVGEMEVEGS